MAEIRELVLTFLELISYNALPTNRKRETVDNISFSTFHATVEFFEYVNHNFSIHPCLVVAKVVGTTRMRNVI